MDNEMAWWPIFIISGNHEREPISVMSTIFAPFTPEQVESLNGFQHKSHMHPFTCGNDECRGKHRDPLYAIEEGWRCQYCDYTQEWAHDFMANGSWRKYAEEMDHLFNKELWCCAEVVTGPSAKRLFVSSILTSASMKHRKELAHPRRLLLIILIGFIVANTLLLAGVFLGL